MYCHIAELPSVSQTGCVFVWCMRWRLFSGRLSLCPEGTDVPLWVFRPCKGELKSRINECRYCFNRCLLGHSLRLRATHLSALQTTQRAPGAGALPSYFCPLHLINADDFIPSARPLFSCSHCGPVVCYSFFANYWSMQCYVYFIYLHASRGL